MENGAFAYQAGGPPIRAILTWWAGAVRRGGIGSQSPLIFLIHGLREWCDCRGVILPADSGSLRTASAVRFIYETAMKCMNPGSMSIFRPGDSTVFNSRKRKGRCTAECNESYTLNRMQKLTRSRTFAISSAGSMNVTPISEIFRIW